MNPLKFAGHESFVCKQYWLKKGYDHIKDNRNFKDEDAVVDLGVGKNMVRSIAFWIRAFGIIDDDGKITILGNFLFGNKGVDKYLEDNASIWLLHYFLVKTGYSSIYNLFFNEFRKERNEFHKEHLHSFLRRTYEERLSSGYNQSTINSDITVFLKSYLRPQIEGRIDFEDEYSGLLNELNLISCYQEHSSEHDRVIDYYRLTFNHHHNLPIEIVLFSILDNFSEKKSISIKELEVGNNSPGMVFCLSQEGLYNKILSLTNKYENITYSSAAGVGELQIKGNIDKWKVLQEYYGRKY